MNLDQLFLTLADVRITWRSKLSPCLGAPLDQPVNSSEADAQPLLGPMFSQDKIQLGSKTLSYTLYFH